jgi:hypothetical protein
MVKCASIVPNIIENIIDLGARLALQFHRKRKVILNQIAKNVSFESAFLNTHDFKDKTGILNVKLQFY